MAASAVFVASVQPVWVEAAEPVWAALPRVVWEVALLRAYVAVLPQMGAAVRLPPLQVVVQAAQLGVFLALGLKRQRQEAL